MKEKIQKEKVDGKNNEKETMQEKEKKKEHVRHASFLKSQL